MGDIYGDQRNKEFMCSCGKINIETVSQRKDSLGLKVRMVNHNSITSVALCLSWRYMSHEILHLQEKYDHYIFMKKGILQLGNECVPFIAPYLMTHVSPG